MTGSLAASLTNSNQTNIVGYNTSTGQLFYQTTSSLTVATASYALTASNVIGGTTNYIPRWVTPTSLASSAMYQDPTTGGIGIGINNIYAQFAVGKPSGVSDTNNLGLTAAYTGQRNAINSFLNLITGSAALDFFADEYVFKIGTLDKVLIDNGGHVTTAGNVGITGSLTATGSVKFAGLTNVNQTNVVSYNTSNGQLYYQPTSSLNALSASYAATSSYAYNFTIANQLTFDQTLMDYASVASSIAGSNNLFTQATGSYTSAFFKYTVSNSTNSRSGEMMAVWNGASVQFTDNSTLDIGTTSPVTCSVSLVAGDVQFNVQTNTSGWRIKSIGTFM